MTGKRILYSDAEMGWLERNCTMVIGDYHAAFCKKFKRWDVTPDRLNEKRIRHGWKTGRNGRFAKGHTINKGRMRADMLAEQSLPVGTERITKSGTCVVRKVSYENPYWKRWRAAHILNWEEAHGKVPDGHFLKCLDGNTLNTDASNWEAVPKGLIPRLCCIRKFDTASPDLKPTIMAVAKLEHSIRRKSRGGRIRWCSPGQSKLRAAGVLNSDVR